MAHLYLVEELEDAAAGDVVTVAGAEARHAVTVGRLRVGESTRLSNGRGLVVTGTVTGAEPSSLAVSVESVERVPRARPALWLAQALAKGDRDELAVQSATELGVDGVIPWSAHRSIVKWEGSKLAKHHDRWAAILREAAKQSMRAHVPELAPLVSSRSLARLASDHQTVVLEPGAAEPLSALAPDGRDVLIIVGPEGGISPAEHTMFVEAGATPRRLGESVLRTSTAGPAALSVLSVVLGRW